ncbi:transporter [Sulfurimonas sp. NWX79]|uniref:transporter n=1 Tax=Sulfurimonas sp. NWX79 TaxID=2925412 RepID=UPI003204B60E
MKKIFLGTALVAFISVNIQAEIIADRPGFSTGTYTVKPGKFNIEMGYNYTFDTFSSQNNTQDFPLFELRTGVTEDIEFDFLWDGWSTTKDFKESPTSDITIGGKYSLIKNEKYNFTFMTLVTLPTDRQSSFKTENISPLIGLLWDYTLNETISFFGTFQSSTYRDEKRIYDFQPAAGITFSHTEKFASFIELYSIIPSSSIIPTEKVVDGGFTYLLQENIQLDINGGLGLNRESEDFFGLGIAIEF